MGAHPPGLKDALLKAAQPMPTADAHIVVATSAKILAEHPDIRGPERQFMAMRRNLLDARASKQRRKPACALTSSRFIPWRVMAGVIDHSAINQLLR